MVNILVIVESTGGFTGLPASASENSESVLVFGPFHPIHPPWSSGMVAGTAADTTSAACATGFRAWLSAVRTAAFAATGVRDDMSSQCELRERGALLASLFPLCSPVGPSRPAANRFT